MQTVVRISDKLKSFPVISLDEMKGLRLMNRTDTKYVFSAATLEEILELAAGEYKVQQVDGMVCSPYHTVYLDTPGMEMYMAHQNGRKTREKIRVRTYLSSNLSFLEVKNKSNKGRTDKRRMVVADPEHLPEDAAETFLSKYAFYMMPEIAPRLENRFQRITLVNNAMTERLTIDTDIRFLNLRNGNYISLPNIVVMELKRDGHVTSPILKTLNRLRVKRCGFSKYCIGSAMTDHELKQNRFKKRMHRIEKLMS